MKPSRGVTSFCLLLPSAVAAAGLSAQAGPRIGMIDPAASPGPRNAAAAAFAATVGEVTRLQPSAHGGLQGADRRRAPEEFDVVWYHEGDDPAAPFPDAAIDDLAVYVRQGGAMLLSGAAGRLLPRLELEPTVPRVLGPAPDGYVSGLVVVPEHRHHPAFAGLDTSGPILLTGFGGNALADFYGTPGPHGTLLAEGNAGQGERPLVEYAAGRGRVIFVGWRLADFSTAGDAHRPNLERFFRNLLAYLSERNTNRARLMPPAGRADYIRVLGVPFMVAWEPEVFRVAPQPAERSVIVLAGGPPDDSAVQDGPYFVSQWPAAERAVTAQAVTLCQPPRPVSAFLEQRRAEQDEWDRQDRLRLGGAKVVVAKVTTRPAPLRPEVPVEPEQSVLLGRSAYMAPGDGLGDVTAVYEPLEDGGFRIAGSRRSLNRLIVCGQNRLVTGDVPLFRMETGTGAGCYSADRMYPLWPRPDAQSGQATPCLGTLRLGVAAGNGATIWLDELEAVTATFRPGYTAYDVEGPGGAWKASLVAAPSPGGHGMVCRIAFDRDVVLRWRCGGLWWLPGEALANRVEFVGRAAEITEPGLPGGLTVAGCDVEGTFQAVTGSAGQEAEFSAAAAGRRFHVAATWGVLRHDEDLAVRIADRLNTPVTAGWSEDLDRMKQAWRACFVEDALRPRERFAALIADPGQALQSVCGAWDRRRQEFRIRTPDARLNALINWERCRSAYHRKGPGLYLGEIWQMYSHISTGWYGLQWGGDHEAAADNLRLYAAFQTDGGFIQWVSPSLVGFLAENNTPYWVDQVWWHYAWTGDRAFAARMWPAVRRAVAWQCRQNDPDGDGLFQDWYEYWNGDSNGKGPKAAAPSAMSWAMLDRAARLGEAVGDAAAAAEYRALAERTRQAVFRELWREDKGRLGSIGGEGIWRGHGQTWEQYLAINAGLLEGQRGRRAMRWLASHYGFEPQPGVRLLSCSDWFPIRWSTQWVPTGDTMLAALAGMKCGDVAVWWPYVQTAVGSAFRSEFPGIGMGISNFGAGGGDREDVDSVDPFVHWAVRGLFGIEPAVHEGRIDICPAFPADWTEASLRTPDLEYEYHREGDRATFRILTPRPLVRRVRAAFGGPEVVTPPETGSLVTVAVPEPPAPPGSPDHPPTILAEQQPPTPQEQGLPLPAEERDRLVVFDLAAACNTTLERLILTPFHFDYEGLHEIPGVTSTNPQLLQYWWGNPGITIPPSPRVLEAPTGVPFLTAGRPRCGRAEPPPDLLALSSWPPYPLPGGATIEVGMHCRRLWLLLQGYVHPMKNYIPNGEVILAYDDGSRHVESLIPPFNLDGYFQHFARRGTPVPRGRISTPHGWGFVHPGMMNPHADALEIPCDPSKVLAAVEIRATCTEGVIGVVGMTALAGP